MNIDSVKKELPVWVTLKKQQVPAKILDFAPSHEGDYLQTKLEIYVYNPLTGQTITSVYPKPVQSYKLRHRKVEQPPAAEPTE